MAPAALAIMRTRPLACTVHLTCYPLPHYVACVLLDTLNVVQGAKKGAKRECGPCLAIQSPLQITPTAASIHARTATVSSQV